MAKPSLTAPFQRLESEIIYVLMRGHAKWRPDLAYPESYSDMQAAVRELLENYEVVPLKDRRKLTLEGEPDDGNVHKS